MIWAFAIAAGIVLIGLISQYNKLVYLRQLARNAWSDVDVYLKRRSELIPNLTASVRAYAAHESQTFEELAAARARANKIHDTAQRAAAESQIAAGLSRALLIAENYPELKANQNFLELQREIIETERLIANARQYYNACVRDYNTRIEAFPSNLVAPLVGCRHAPFFEADSLEAVAPGIEMEGGQLGAHQSPSPTQEDQQRTDQHS